MINENRKLIITKEVLNQFYFCNNWIKRSVDRI